MKVKHLVLHPYGKIGQALLAETESVLVRGLGQCTQSDMTKGPCLMKGNSLEPKTSAVFFQTPVST